MRNVVQHKVKGYSIDYPSNPVSLYKLIYKKKIKSENILNNKYLKKKINEFKPHIVFHLAAQSIISEAKKNPLENYKTNVIGTENLVQACFDNDVKRMVALSTDKAAAPINMYGASKLVSDKLLIAGNNIRGDRDLNFSIVRYGNVMGTRGSVIPLFVNQIKND